MKLNAKKIAIIATLDSKGSETGYLRAGLEARDRSTFVLDVGTAGVPTIPFDFSREMICARGGGVSDQPMPGGMLAVVVKGAKAIISDLVSDGEIGAVVGIGGGKGSGAFHQIVCDLPFGFPKVLVTSARPALLAEVATTSDTILFPTLVDLFGLNMFTRAVLDNAVQAVSGLDWSPSAEPSGRMVAITAFGVTTPAAKAIKERLEQAGMTAIVFPANGAGGRTMESLIEKNTFDGVIDLTTTELADLLLGGTASAGEARLTAAGRVGIPQVIAPGAVDMANFGPPATVPSRFSDRITYHHTPMTTLVRTTADETAEIARMTANRLNRATGAVAVFWPSQGVSDYDRPGNSFHDPIANAAWREALGQNLKDGIPIIDAENHINDPAFAALCADWMIAQLEEPT